MTKEEAIQHLEEMKKGIFLWDMSELIDLCISALSENKGEDRPKSQWITYRNSDRCECANCGHQIHYEYPYCPNCGADMRGGKE